MAYKCPVDPKGHGDQESQLALSSHIQQHHPELLSGTVQPIPTVPNAKIDSGVRVTKTIQDLDKVSIQKPQIFTPDNLPVAIPQGQDESVGTGKKSASTEELLSVLKNAPKEEQQPKPDRKPKEIKLTYKYIGECPTCFGEVRTFMIRTKEEPHAVAMCVNCNEQLAEMTVVDLYSKEEKHGIKRT